MKISLNYNILIILKLLILVAIADEKIDCYEYSEIESYLYTINCSLNQFQSFKTLYLTYLQNRNLLSSDYIKSEFYINFMKVKENMNQKDLFQLQETFFLIMYQWDWKFSDLELFIKNYI